MTDPWNMWDNRVHSCGRPDRVASEMAHAELLALLGDDRHGRRDLEKQIIRQELLTRLESGHRSEGSVQASPFGMF